MSTATFNKDIVIHVNGDSGKGHANGDFGKEQNGETYPSKQTNDTKTKKEVKKDMKKIGARELFKYATGFDRVILFLGVIFSMTAGLGMPLNLFVYGSVATDLIMYDSIQNMTAPSKYAEVYDNVRSKAFWFCMIGVGVLIFAFLSVTFFTVAAERQMRTIRKLFFESVMRQEISWFDTHENGELASRFSEDMYVIEDGIGDKVATMIQWTTSFIAAYVLAFISGWKLALASAAFCPIIIMFGAFMTKSLRSIAQREAQSYAKAGAVAEEVFVSIRTVMAFNGQGKECNRYNDNLVDANKESARKGIVSGLGQSTFWFFVYSAFAVAFWYGMYLTRTGELKGFEPGETLTVFMGVMMGAMALGQAFPTLEVIGSARGAAQKVYEIIDQKSSIDFSSKEGKKLDIVQGNITFSNLHFTYPARPDVKILKGLTLEVKKGQTVALVGSSGCGKSTGIQLLQRFYDLENGQILLDGVNIKELNVKWLREQIGVVSQEPVLFATTIAENIKYGKMDVTQAEIENAAKMANAHEFIKQLPEGYETLVGNRGAQLSGGQKQRVAIARALVRNPKILLLDEATSALDNESEGIVQKALEKAQEGRTTIVIAHRLSTIRNADIIYAISEGVVAESGTHSELMSKKGLYHQLVTLQTKQHDKSEEAELRLEKKYLSDNQLNLLSHRSTEYVAEEIEHEFFPNEEGGEKSALIRQRTNSMGSTRKRTFSDASPKKHKLQTEASVVSKDTEEENEDDEEKKEEEEITLVPMSKILKMNSPEWHLIVTGIIVSVLAGALQPSFSILLSEFIKAFNYDHEEQKKASLILVGITMGVAVVSALFKLIINVTFCRAGGNLTTRFRRHAFKSIVWQDATFFDDPKNTVGALTSKLSSDATLVQGATGNKIGNTLEALTTILAALIIAFVFSWKLTFVVLGFLPLMIATGIIHNKILTGFAKGDKHALGKAGKLFSEVVDNIRTVVSLTREQTFIEQCNSYVDHVYLSGRKKSVVNGFVYGLSMSIQFFSYAGAFTYGAYLVQYENLEFHLVFRVFIAIIVGGMHSGRTMSHSMDFKKGQVAASRLFEIIETQPAIDAEADEGDQPDGVVGDIELKNVKFRYPARPDVKVLNGLTIQAKPGETIALVGSSGCGKSTTVQLVERFYDPEDGDVFIDGKKVKSLNVNWLRSKIGIVSQEPVLFDTSIAENIAYGDTSRKVPMSDIIEAARSANIHNFIESLPHGYDTNVGDKGTQLSGGQKQRVAIARALIRNPKILLLDEATSALDTESERVVQDALDKAQEGRTCLVIAHRLSTIQNANKIAIIHKGEVVELGSHSELMAFKGIYYKLSTHNQGK